MSALNLGSRLVGILFVCGPVATATTRPQSVPPPLPAPFVELVDALPYGEQLGATATPDGAFGIVAQGAAFAVVDLNSFEPSGEPKTQGYVELPQISPMAMRYHYSETVHRLFVAGGTTGLWRADLCPSLFTSTPQPCATQPVLIERWSHRERFALLNVRSP